MYNYFQRVPLVKCCCCSNPPKPFKILAVMKHSKKILVMKQFLRKVLSLYFDFLLKDL